MTALPLFEELREALSGRQPKRLGAPPKGVLPASVLVPLFADRGVLRLLFIKRPHGDYPHAGQIAFPGGKRNDGELSLACALREAQEEVGLRPGDVQVLGELDEFDTVVSGFRISPFVGVIPCPYEFHLDEREAERLVFAPLTTLLDPRAFREETRTAFGHTFPVYYYTVDHDLVWGVTAGMLTPLLKLIRSLPSCPE
jgi:8-oxo-dGTP pyrophosphatase MutT (NUDIX family)